jgi:hypothetical protein
MGDVAEHLAKLERTVPIYGSVIPIVFVTSVTCGGKFCGFVRYGHKKLMDAVRAHVESACVDVFYFDEVLNAESVITADTTIDHILVGQPKHARIVVRNKLGVGRRVVSVRSFL